MRLLMWYYQGLQADRKDKSSLISRLHHNWKKAQVISAWAYLEFILQALVSHWTAKCTSHRHKLEGNVGGLDVKWKLTGLLIDLDRSSPTSLPSGKFASPPLCRLMSEDRFWTDHVKQLTEDVSFKLYGELKTGGLDGPPHSIQGALKAHYINERRKLKTGIGEASNLGRGQDGYIKGLFFGLMSFGKLCLASWGQQ